jgi:hypothetical protein
MSAAPATLSTTLSANTHLQEILAGISHYFGFVTQIRFWALTEVPVAPTAEERDAMKKVAALVATENRKIDLAIQALNTIKAYNEEFVRAHDETQTVAGW